MEELANTNSEQPTISSDVTDHNHDNLVSGPSDHDGIESNQEIVGEEVRSILEVIAATGKFWHDWDKLKTMLSFHLKQVLSEYPEEKMASDQQNSSLGESYQELVKRLDDALNSFLEGPPFTLQRLCEILLAAQNIYPNLSKLALALEKNLLVTSTLTICTDPYTPAPMQTPNEQDNGTEEPQQPPNPVPNGVDVMVGDRDEIMAEVEADNNDDEMTIDMEAFEDTVRSSEPNSIPTENS